jgi:hypothetical protein
MTMDSKAIMNRLVSYGQRCAMFTTVLGHEPKSAPAVDREAVTLALFSGPIGHARSGFASTSLRWEIGGRIYLSAFTEPADDIDPLVVDATTAYLAFLCAHYSLDGLIANVDIRGADGDPLLATPGYIEQDSKVFRAMELRIPLIINDVMPEAA